MRTTRIALATLACAIGSVALAAPALATLGREELVTPAQVWVQSFERPSAEAPCIAPGWLQTPWQADWPVDENVWTASWEQWANNDQGGWTCTRSITWAPRRTPASSSSASARRRQPGRSGSLEPCAVP